MICYFFLHVCFRFSFRLLLQGLDIDFLVKCMIKNEFCYSNRCLSNHHFGMKKPFHRNCFMLKRFFFLVCCRTVYAIMCFNILILQQASPCNFLYCYFPISYKVYYYRPGFPYGTVRYICIALSPLPNLLYAETYIVYVTFACKFLNVCSNVVELTWLFVLLRRDLGIAISTR